MSIKRLNRDTINLINCTQVISSIYSAVKELVENSLDALAQNIEVNLVDSGLSLIEVKDNGVGVPRDEALCMALPSYTSKITDLNDLDLLATYGFRGEGLTAICQVAEVTISTKTAEDETVICHTLDYEGNVVKSDVSHGTTGTTVRMKNIFKNMPVRRNLLTKKRLNQEIKAIETLLKAYAICKPSVRFVFRVNSTVIFTKAICKSDIDSIKCVMGIQVFSKMTHVKKCFSETELLIIIPKKENKDVALISQPGMQLICVNDRPIKSKEIEKRVKQKLAEYFCQTSGSHKLVFCLLLTVKSSALDVNLEPNKDKVFLHNEAEILKEINQFLCDYYELQDSLEPTQKDDSEKMENEEVDSEETHLVKEKEFQACKRRKTNGPIEKIHSAPSTEQDSKQILDKRKRESDDEFLKDIVEPMLSDSDSNDGIRVTKNFNKKKKISGINSVPENENESELFDFAPQTKIIEDKPETLSQLPVVDLGEDFDWEEIINKATINKETDKTASLPTHEISQKISNLPNSHESWSKGHIVGLEGGVAIGLKDGDQNNKIDKSNSLLQESEAFDYGPSNTVIEDSQEISENDGPHVDVNKFDWNLKNKNMTKKTSERSRLPGSSKQRKMSQKAHEDPNQSKIQFAGDNACLKTLGHSAFSMYCSHERKNILEQSPDLSPAEIALELNKQWKNLSSEERDYYRDLANKNNEEISLNISQLEGTKKEKLSQTEKISNRKKLVNMLENMKLNKNNMKNESLLMRTFVNWDIDLESVTEKFENRRAVNKINRQIVGSLNSDLWVLNMTSNLFVFNIAELQEQLQILKPDASKVDEHHVKNLVEQWFKEKDDMSIFHPIYTIES
ncbi:hypothetical protein TKK_0017793 [Trichogramma kaykai]|uniref:HMG box domain-containing protein n=1 Tax=Trichogramma kaykai TaxID=54128 RepID=A0ABD2W2Q5_9HYME